MPNPPPDDRTRIATGGLGPVDTSLPATLFNVGEVIGGSYKVLSFIGRGGMGDVYRVRHLFLDKELALKTLSGNQVSDVLWKRFQIEGQAIARLDHQSIIRIYDLGITGDNHPYYVMDIVEGVSLAEKLKEEGALTPDLALPIFRQISAGLAYAHERGIIHRDLKPANIMLLSPDKSSGRHIPTVKILDFGLAKLTDLASGAASGLTKPGEVFGSPLYMSPEQAKGQLIDQTTDIYSFGCTLFETLTGRVPLQGNNAVDTMLMHANKIPPRLADVRPDLPFAPELERLVAKLLAKEKGQRYQSFAEVANALLMAERPGQTSITPQTTGQNKSAQMHNYLGQDDSGAISRYGSAHFTNKKYFWPVLAVVGAVGLSSTMLLTYNLFTPKPNLPARYATTSGTVAVGQASAPATETQAEKQEAGGTWGKYSKTTEIDGVKMKIFDFPSEPSLGRIVYEMNDSLRTSKCAEWRRKHPDDKSNPFSKVGLPARGHVEYLASDKIGFIPSEDTCNTPALFKKFRADDFVRLHMNDNRSVDSDTLQYVKHLKGLNEIDLSETSVDDRCLKVLDAMPKLDSLKINNTKITGAALAKCASLQRLTRLEFSDGTQTGLVIRRLRNSTHITYLRISGSPLLETDFAILNTLPRLELLAAQECGITDSALKALAKNQHISNLDIKHNLKVTAGSIPTFASMHVLNIELSEGSWTAEQIAELQNVLKKTSHGHAQFDNLGEIFEDKK